MLTHQIRSEEKKNISLQQSLQSAEQLVAQRDECIAAHCKQSTYLQSEIFTLGRKVEELVDEKEGLRVSLNEMVSNKEGEEKRLNELEMDQESAKIKVDNLRLELELELDKETLEIAEAHAEVE